MFCFPILLLVARPALGSWGDRAPLYRQCRGDCASKECGETSIDTWAASQSTADSLVGWTCLQDCSYSCMWKTVEVYGEQGRVPQFHGKWPFLRLWGLQEPLSVLASLANLATNSYMVLWFVKRVPSTAPMYWVWVGYGLTAVNAWVWSSVFHTKDSPLTEMADYFSALATVLSSLLAFCLRQAHGSPSSQLAISSLFLAFFSHHMYQMATLKFDYGYNMKVNVASGGLNCVAWLLWFLLHRSEGRHILSGALAVLLVASSVALELLDFPPLYWVIDSHALWHIATVPLPLLWMRFASADSLLLLEEQTESSKLKKTE